jgi:hypothetical protein
MSNDNPKRTIYNLNISKSQYEKYPDTRYFESSKRSETLPDWARYVIIQETNASSENLYISHPENLDPGALITIKSHSPRTFYIENCRQASRIILRPGSCLEFIWNCMDDNIYDCHWQLLSNVSISDIIEPISTDKKE